MELFTPINPESSSSLGMALVVSSATPLLLLNPQLVVKAASETFCRAFDLRIEDVVGAAGCRHQRLTSRHGAKALQKRHVPPREHERRAGQDGGVRLPEPRR